ncbi:MAG TPA: SH3 domain-containing protein, partial [Candidatus Deferrimicrobium sp.]|nr:SH3 domain-containing protein [Candidatus Deferrimicrobium sp.]
MNTFKPAITISIFILIFLLFNLQAAAMQVKIIEKQCDIHEKPDFKSNILMQVNTGTLLEVKEKTGEWYHVFLPRKNTGAETTGWVFQSQVEEVKEKKKDRLFLMGIGMVRLNWAKVKGDAIRFRYSDLGLPADFSTRERASFMIDGTFGNQKYNIDGHVNYDPENRITEPALEFLLTVGNEKKYLSVGDFQMGVMMDSVFSRYYHPFRGGILGARTNRFGVEVMAGVAGGESGIEEFS